jgi:hypothetical protein
MRWVLLVLNLIICFDGRYESAKTDEQKKKCFEEMQALSAANHVKILGSDLFTFYETWKHSVVRELAVAMPGAKPNEIAKVCRPAISAADVSDSLHFSREGRTIDA